MLPSRLLFVVLLTACAGPRGPAPVIDQKQPEPVSSVSRPPEPDALHPQFDERKNLSNGRYEINGVVYTPLTTSRNFHEQGVASWYGPNFHGKKTANGEDYDMERMTAAHPTLPLPTFVEVTNLKTGKKLIVRVNDRGPFHDGRIIDLSHAAARALDVVQAGTAPVRLRALQGSEIAQVQQNPEYRNHPKLFVQLGAFSSADTAQQQRSKLTQQLTLPLEVVTNRKAATPVHILRIGPLADMTTATETLSQARLAGLNQAFIRLDTSAH